MRKCQTKVCRPRGEKNPNLWQNDQEASQMWGEECAPVPSRKPWNRTILKTLSVTCNVGTNSVHSNFMWNKVGTWQKEALWLFGQARVTDVQAYCTRGKVQKRLRKQKKMLVYWGKPCGLLFKLCVQETISYWQATVDKLSKTELLIS